MGRGEWTPASRLTYNLRDTISRSTVQVTNSINFKVQITSFRLIYVMKHFVGLQFRSILIGVPKVLDCTIHAIR